MNNTMTCPNCHHGRIVGFAGPHSIPCPICNGTGILPEGVVYDPERGRLMRETRLNLGLSLRDACVISGEDVQVISERERGFSRS